MGLKQSWMASERRIFDGEQRPGFLVGLSRTCPEFLTGTETLSVFVTKSYVLPGKTCVPDGS